MDTDSPFVFSDDDDVLIVGSRNMRERLGIHVMTSLRDKVLKGTQVKKNMR